jgi:transposase-like protein
MGSLRLQISEQQIREVYETDEKLESAALRLGCSVGTLHYRFDLLGLPRKCSARGRRLAQEVRQQLLAAANSKEPACDVARRFGVHPTTVGNLRRRIVGSTRRRYRYDIEKLRRACQIGMTLAEIAGQMGLPSDTVRNALKRFGLRYRRTNNRKPIDRASFVRDFRAGLTLTEMAQRHGFSSPSAVRSRLQTEGLLPRAKAGA